MTTARAGIVHRNAPRLSRAVRVTFVMVLVVGSFGLALPAFAANTGTWTVSVSPSSVNENSGSTMTFTVTRGAPIDGSCKVTATVTGTATLGTDYTSNRTNPFTFDSGSGNSQTIVITPTGDATSEPDETVIVTLSNATAGCTVGTPSTATGTIKNDDASLSIGNVTQAEGNAGTSTFNFTITLANTSAVATTGTYSTAPSGTNPATAGAACGVGTDYVTVTGGAWTIPANTSSTTVPVTVCGDTTFEPNETFSVTITSSGNTITNATGTGTITDDDAAGLSVTIADSPDPATQGGNITYTVTVSNAGPAQATNAAALIQLPSQVSWVSNTPSQGTCDGATGTSTVQCDFGSINSAGSATVTLVTQAQQPGTATALVDVFADQEESNYANNSASTTTTITGLQADISLSLTDGPDPVASGGRIIYTAVVSNTGPSTAYGVTFSLPLDGTTTFYKMNRSQGSCTAPAVGQTGTVSCNLRSIAASSSATVRIWVTTTAPGTVSVTGTVTELNPDPSPGDHSAGTSTTVT